MRTFCITCKEFPARWPLADRHLRSAGIQAEPFFGIAATRYGVAPKERKVLCGNRHYHQTDGHLGCCMSHYALWRALQYMPQDETLVFEDDANVPSAFLTQFDLMLKDVPSDWDFIHVGHGSYDAIQKTNGSLGKPIGRYPYGTHCYMISKNAATYLAKNIFNFRLPIDVLLAVDYWPNANYYCTETSLVSQHSEDGLWVSTTQERW